MKPDFQKEAELFFPDTHTEKYIYDGPHQSISPKYAREQQDILTHRRCFVYGMKKGYQSRDKEIEELTLEKQVANTSLEFLHKEIEELKAEIEKLRELDNCNKATMSNRLAIIGEKNSEIESLKAEIERLSKLIKRIYKISEYDANHDNIMYAFQDIHRLCEKIIKQGISPRPTS